jgi:uncharacterized protein (TIGR02145 family)
MEEIKVRWKKAAMENCPGVPCITATVPGPPTSVTVSAGNASASVAFVAPTNNGGSAITGYTVTSSPGGITATGTTSPINVTGLTNGTAYTFRVVATNAIGNSVASAASTAVTPVAPNTVPGPPTAVVATAGNASASVAFVAPTNNGGSAITGYTVTSSPGGITATGTTSPINVTGLTNGTAYTFTIVATNAIGNSSPSTASSAVTPSAPTVPGPPTSVTAVGGNAQATISFTAPASNGGSPITGYTVTSSPGGITGTGSGSPITVSGLTNGTAYTFSVVATNAIGNSSPSTASSAVTPSAPFSCGTTVADIDGNTYNTVLIGSQCWTKENLKVTKYNDGSPIPDETANTAGWGGLATGARSDYTGAASYIATYGYLYNWYAAKGVSTRGSTTYKNICPTGWHVPTDGQWTDLETQLGGISVAGGKMKSTSSLWNSPNTGADNTSGFTALPGGCRNNGGSFNNIRNYACFWSATEDTSLAWLRRLSSNDSNVNRFNFPKSVGASVRCLRD